jgi:hypothetical protein
VVHNSTSNSIWRYMEVHASTRIGEIVDTGTCWNELPYGSIRVCFSAGFSASILPGQKRCIGASVSNHTNAGSSMFQSTAACPAANLMSTRV